MMRSDFILGSELISEVGQSDSDNENAFEMADGRHY
jgi:hypothetical protein